MSRHGFDPCQPTDLTTTTISQAAELGDTGRQVVLWVAMALALWQLLMFAASTFVQGENLPVIIGLELMVAHWFRIWGLS